MRIGVLIVGSLLWEDTNERQVWRESHLALDDKVFVRVPIRYGRRSRKRGNTFTMTIDACAEVGQAIVLPTLVSSRDVSALYTEAEALWLAEQPGATSGAIFANWGCVGVCG